MRIVMVGAGYVGLVTASCLADLGHEVLCVEVDKTKVAALKKGQVPIYERGLSELVIANQNAGRLSFTASLSEVARGPHAIFIAVGTPTLAEIGSADMHYVHDAARAIAGLIEDFAVIVVKLTVPVGACDEVERIIAERVPRNRFAVVSNPEFLREGAAIEDFKQPERVVIGVEDERARLVMAKIYEPLEAVRKHHAGLHSFRSMRRMEARRRKASALRLRHSQSLASLRQRPSQARVRSTIQRLGRTTKPLAWPNRLTISRSTRARMRFIALWNSGPW